MEIGFVIRRILSKRLRESIAFILVITTMSSRAGTNSWIKATSGAWQETNSWSLAILPDSSQSLAITNSGEKTVTINSATAQNFPSVFIRGFHSTSSQ